MRKLFLSGASAVAMMLNTSIAHAENSTGNSMGLDWYVNLFGGYSTADKTNFDFIDLAGISWDATHTWDNGFLIGGAIGTRVFDTVRAEVELSYQGIDAGNSSIIARGITNNDHGSNDAIFLLGNIWYDIDLGTPLIPYVGGGIGVAFVDQKIDIQAPGAPGGGVGTDGTDTTFAFQVGAGLKYHLTDKLALDLSYRFRGITGVDILGQVVGRNYNNQDIYTHNVLVGITYNFN